MAFITKSEFARRHGFSKQYVTELIHMGIIQETNGKLDEDDADYALSLKRAIGRERHTKNTGKNLQELYIEAKLKNELVKGELLKMEAEEKAKTLMPASVIEETLFTKGRVIRDALMNIPDRISSLVASIDDEGEVHNIISTEIRVCLEELTRGY